jgi:hypothetical protein
MPAGIFRPSIWGSDTSSEPLFERFRQRFRAGIAFSRDTGKISYMKIRMIIGCVLTMLGAFPAGTAYAGSEVYQTPDEFIAEVFSGRSPDAQALWIKPDLRRQLTEVLGHNPGLRQRYWGGDQRTVWVLDEIGKDRPITAGVVVNDGAIEEIRVLVFRESRGWEVKYPFFTRQFLNARLEDRDLSRNIDGITGATLSVRAMKRMARAALLLHEHTTGSNSTLAQAR